ncbi:MAG: glycosyltransferase [Deltaproteobacteria bacterium]|jgi:glycosyltransferase involved in cell wall biosynthesis
MISIVIPTLSEEKVIGKSLQTLKSDMTIPHEIIVSDGGSTDKTVEIAGQWADRVIIYSGTGRQTIGYGRNDGAAVAKGEFLVFMDADSRINNPDAFFAEAMKQFEEHPEVVALTSKVRVYPEDETRMDRIVFSVLSFNIRVLNNLLHRGESVGEFQMMRKETFDKLGGFRSHLVTREDADMFLRLSQVGRTMFDPQLLVYHSGRRAHRIGWPKLLFDWAVNTIWVALFDKAFAREWKVIR